ncbi:MAG: hypothetical protein IJ341_01925 [Bacteroidales bacterium]|nr:hypothetical protein [Bacteroidales bacterium]
MLKRIGKYFVSFAKEEEGAEFLEIVLGIIFAVMLAGGMYILINSLSGKVDEATELIDNLSGGGGVSPTSPT